MIKRSAPFLSTKSLAFGLLIAFATIWASGLQAGLPGWIKRMRITIDNSMQTGALDNFKIAVTLTDGGNINFSDLQANADDLRFVDDDNITVIPHEVEGTWDPAGPNVVWVRVPEIVAPPTADFIYLYYKSASGTEPNVESSAGVWPSTDGHQTVFHMAEDPSGGIVDSSSNANNGTALGGMNGTDVVAGQIGKCLEFDGSNDSVDVTNVLNPLGIDVSASAWFRATSAASQQREIIQQTDSGGTGRAWLYRLTSNQIRTNIGNVGLQSTTVTAMGTWYHVACSYDDTTNTLRIYVDGDEENVQGGVTSETTTGLFRMNGGKTGGNRWPGHIDEVRISNTLRSVDWFLAEYRNGTVPTYLTYADDPPNDFDSTITASVTLIEPSQIDSVTGSAASQAILDFVLADNIASGDGFPTVVTQVETSIVSSGDAANHTWTLNGPDVIDLPGVISGSIGTQTLTFDVSASPISIIENGSETYTISLEWGATPSATTDGSFFLLSLDDTNLTTSAILASSQFATGQTAVDNGAGVEYEVVATKFNVTTQPPASVVVGTPFNMIGEYTDANNNRDFDTNGDTATLTRSDNVTVAGTALSVLGSVSFTGASQITLTNPSAANLQLLLSDDAGGSITIAGSTASNAFSLTAQPVLTTAAPDNGPVVGGTLVAITGTSLGAVNWVTFNGQSATIVSTSETQLDVLSPAQTEDVVADIFVSNGQFSTTLTAAFTYGTPLPPSPSITTAVPITGELAGGEAIAITGTNLQSILIATVGGKSAVIENTSSTLVTIIAPAGVTAGAVSISVGDGVSVATLSNAYTYNAAPSAPHKGKDVSPTNFNCALSQEARVSYTPWAILIFVALLVARRRRREI